MYEHMLFTLFFYRQTVPMLRVTTHDVGFEMFFLLFKILFWTFQVIKKWFLFGQFKVGSTVTEVAYIGSIESPSYR